MTIRLPVKYLTIVLHYSKKNQPSLSHLKSILSEHTFSSLTKSGFLNITPRLPVIFMTSKHTLFSRNSQIFCPFMNTTVHQTWVSSLGYDLRFNKHDKHLHRISMPRLPRPKELVLILSSLSLKAAASGA